MTKILIINIIYLYLYWFQAGRSCITIQQKSIQLLHPFYFTKCLNSQKNSNIASSHITKKIDLQKVSELVVSFYFTPMYLLYTEVWGFSITSVRCTCTSLGCWYFGLAFIPLSSVLFLPLCGFILWCKIKLEICKNQQNFHKKYF